MSREKLYEKILCLIEFIISITFIPMCAFVIVIGGVLFIKFILDFIKMIINN